MSVVGSFRGDAVWSDRTPYLRCCCLSPAPRTARHARARTAVQTSVGIELLGRAITTDSWELQATGGSGQKDWKRRRPAAADFRGGGGDIVHVAVVDPRSAEARHCVRAYYAEPARRFDGGFDPAPQHLRRRPRVQAAGRPPAGSHPARRSGRLWLGQAAPARLRPREAHVDLAHRARDGDWAAGSSPSSKHRPQPSACTPSGWRPTAP